MPAWKPGQSGNLSGRPRTKPISDRYGYIAEEKLPESIQKKLKLGPGATYGDAVALRMFNAALEGDTAATREIHEAIGRQEHSSHGRGAATHQNRHQRDSEIWRAGMNDLESVCIGDYYTPQPKQQESCHRLYHLGAGCRREECRLPVGIREFFRGVSFP